MATYAEITSTKTITLGSSSGTTTLTYYAGNKEKTTGSVVGNANKQTITYYFDTETSWINSVSFTDKDETAKNIVISYQTNNTTSSRQTNLKLKDQTSAYYLIIKQTGKSSSTSYYQMAILCMYDTTYGTPGIYGAGGDGNYQDNFNNGGLLAYETHIAIRPSETNPNYLITDDLLYMQEEGTRDIYLVTGISFPYHPQDVGTKLECKTTTSAEYHGKTLYYYLIHTVSSDMVGNADWSDIPCEAYGYTGTGNGISWGQTDMAYPTGVWKIVIYSYMGSSTDVEIP